MPAPRLDSERALRTRHHIHNRMWKVSEPVSPPHGRRPCRRGYVRDVLADKTIRWRSFYRHLKVLVKERKAELFPGKKGEFLVYEPRRLEDAALLLKTSRRTRSAYNALRANSEKIDGTDDHFTRNFIDPLTRCGFTPRAVNHYARHLQRVGLVRYIPSAVVVNEEAEGWAELAPLTYHLAMLLKENATRKYEDREGYKGKLAVIKPKRILDEAGVRSSEQNRVLDTLARRGVVSRIRYTGGFLVTTPERSFVPDEEAIRLERKRRRLKYDKKPRRVYHGSLGIPEYSTHTPHNTSRRRKSGR